MVIILSAGAGSTYNLIMPVLEQNLRTLVLDTWTMSNNMEPVKIKELSLLRAALTAEGGGGGGRGGGHRNPQCPPGGGDGRERG